MTATNDQADPREVSKFDRLAQEWWDPDGPLATLHSINPARLGYIGQRVELDGARVLDVGCGGGLLSEGMALEGASVIGLDLARQNIEVARRHAAEAGLDIEYRCKGVETESGENPGGYDLVTCLEVLEHVPSPADMIRACAAAVRPGGTVVFSTLNRNAKSFLLAIVAAEYLLGLLPRGSHQYRKLIRPSELARWCRESRLEVADITGMHLEPFSRSVMIGGNVDVNYFCCARRPERA